MSSPESILSDIEGSPLDVPSPVQHVFPERRTENKYDRLFGNDNDAQRVRDEEDAVARRRAGHRVDGADGEHEVDEDGASGDRDLFGDDSDDSPKKELSDAELDHTPDVDQDDEPEKIYRTIDVSLPRHPTPNPGNNDLYLLRVPAVVNLQPSIFYPENFVLPKSPAESTASPYTLATTTIRVRKSPSDPSTLQSNTRIIKWSDGSLSLQIASSPNLYDLTSKPLAPSSSSTTYDSSQDSHTYLLTPHESAGMLRFLAHATQSLNVLPTSTSLANADAISRLHEQLFAAQSSRGNRPGGAPQTMEMTDMRDPEAERKEAERMSRDKERLARKQELRRARAARNLPGGPGDDDRAAARRSYPRNSHTTRSKRDSPPIGGTKGGRSKEDEYDLEDDFVERSDEGEGASDSDDEDAARGRKGKAKGRKPAVKKSRDTPEDEDEEDEEEEAEFTDDDRAPIRGGRAGKRRRVVDDEDDE